MIEREMLDLIRDPKRLDSLADEFRQGRDIADLLPFLNSDNEEILGIGAWIAGEVQIDPANAQPLISRLYRLVAHKSPAVRFHAIDALFPFLDMANPATNQLLVNLSCDSNEGVRLIAQAALKRIQS